MKILALMMTLGTLFQIVKLIIDEQIDMKKKQRTERLRDTMQETINHIIERCALAGGVTVDEIKAKNRKREIVIARQLAAYKIRKRFGNLVTWKRIASELNLKNHATVIHGFNAIESALQTNDQFVIPVMDRYNETEINQAA